MPVADNFGHRQRWRWQDDRRRCHRPAGCRPRHRTLVSSTDPAHSLADALMGNLTTKKPKVAATWSASRSTPRRQLDKHWGSIRDQIMHVFDWGGVSGIEAEEFLVFPGMDELFALLEVNRHARSGKYDVIVVDCAPTAETLGCSPFPRSCLGTSRGSCRPSGDS